MAEFVCEFDASSVMRMNRFIMAEGTFASYYMLAMQRVTAAVAATASEKPYAPVLTGTLRRGIRGFAESPFVGRVGVIGNVPYARRREYGFDEKFDRLGRFFLMDPKDPDKRDHMMYLHRALRANEPLIMQTFHLSANLAIREMSVV